MADLHRKQTVHTLVAVLVAFDMTTAKLQCRWHELFFNSIVGKKCISCKKFVTKKIYISMVCQTGWVQSYLPICNLRDHQVQYYCDQYWSQYSKLKIVFIHKMNGLGACWTTSLLNFLSFKNTYSKQDSFVFQYNWRQKELLPLIMQCVTEVGC